MAITLVSNSTTQGTTSSAINSTGASLIVVALHSDGSTPTISDSKGNSYSQVFGVTAGGERCALYYAANPVVGTGHTVTATGASDFSLITVAAFSGVKTSSPLDQSNSAGAGSGSHSSWQTGSISPTENGELIVAASSILTGVLGDMSWSPDPPFDLIGGLGPSPTYGGLAIYEVQTTATNRNPTFTPSTNFSKYSAGVASFKAAPFDSSTSDSASASEGMSFAATVVRSDTAAGSEGQAYDGAASQADTSTFVESISAGVPADVVSDTSAASEAMTFLFILSVADAASVTDGRAFNGETSRSDTASAGEQGGFSVGVTITDAAAVVDGQTAAASLIASDSAAVFDSTSDINIQLERTFILTEPLPYGT